MQSENNDLLIQLDRHLASPCQSWLFGAGISKGANIPLMKPLTTHVLAMAEGSDHEELLKTLNNELPEDAHIEHLLSHLGDYIALAQRSKAGTVSLGPNTFEIPNLEAAHAAVLEFISKTIRWGYIPPKGDQPENKGDKDNSLVDIKEHVNFVRALFRTSQAGLHDRRRAVHIFTTNYDTLLEDALALCCIPYWDGFTGGALAFRGYRFGQEEPGMGAYRAHLVKLHGSIDWHFDDENRLWRVRDGDTYPARSTRVLIYPQATKYVATQRDPFAAQFDLFRRSLSTSADNVLTVCGYSFGDDHINQEIELAMARPESRTTLISFAFEGNHLPDSLNRWRTSSWGNRVYIATEKGLYAGEEGPFFVPAEGQQRNWWTFAGLTKVLQDGAEGCI